MSTLCCLIYHEFVCSSSKLLYLFAYMFVGLFNNECSYDRKLLIEKHVEENGHIPLYAWKELENLSKTSVGEACVRNKNWTSKLLKYKWKR